MDGVTLTLNNAAPLVGLDRKTLMEWVRLGTCPFGAYIRRPEDKKGHYYINRTRLETYLSGEDMRPRCPYRIDQGGMSNV